jgi:hypothetical protein
VCDGGSTGFNRCVDAGSPRITTADGVALDPAIFGLH